MKVIDKTNKFQNWDYGTVLKCWDDDPKKYYLYRISSPHSFADDNNFELDTLHDPEGNDMLWTQNFYGNIIDIKEELQNGYKHVVPVKATIIIEDL